MISDFGSPYCCWITVAVVRSISRTRTDGSRIGGCSLILTIIVLLVDCARTNEQRTRFRISVVEIADLNLSGVLIDGRMTVADNTLGNLDSKIGLNNVYHRHFRNKSSISSTFLREATGGRLFDQYGPACNGKSQILSVFTCGNPADPFTVGWT